jgi:hypothetical protein
MSRLRTAEVVNPVLAIPGMAEELAALPPEAREALRSFLARLQGHTRPIAEESWKRGKGPMAVYWKCVGVYAGHLSRAIGRASR